MIQKSGYEAQKQPVGDRVHRLIERAMHVLWYPMYPLPHLENSEDRALAMPIVFIIASGFQDEQSLVNETI